MLLILKSCCKVKWICVNRCLRFDECVGVDPAKFNSTLCGTTVLTVFSFNQYSIFLITKQNIVLFQVQYRVRL